MKVYGKGGNPYDGHTTRVFDCENFRRVDVAWLEYCVKSGRYVSPISTAQRACLFFEFAGTNKIYGGPKRFTSSNYHIFGTV